MLQLRLGLVTIQVISVDIPNTIQLEVTETTPGVKGNTVSGGTKSATLETGAVIQVCCSAADTSCFVRTTIHASGLRMLHSKV